MKLNLLHLEAYLLADLFNVLQYMEIKHIQYLLKIEKQYYFDQFYFLLTSKNLIITARKYFRLEIYKIQL